MRARSTFVIVVTAMLLAGGVPARAESVTFFAPNPCGVVCPYWTGLETHPATVYDVDTVEAACRPSPITAPGSFDQTVRTVPLTATTVKFSIFPVDDFDSFVCSVNNLGTPTAPRYHIASGANSVATCVLGCAESSVVTVTAFKGMNLVFRVYNWADTTGSVGGTIDFS